MRHYLLLLCLAGTTAHAACDWNTPGNDRFTGDKASAVMRYTHIPWAARISLAARVARSAPDDVVEIGRDYIASPKAKYDASLSDMNFGSKGLVCGAVDRSKWPDGKVYLAKVWWSGKYSVAVPDVCGNVSLLIRQMPAAKASNTVPEPGTLALSLLAMCAVNLARTRKKY